MCDLMAAAVVGGAFLSAFLDVVFDRLASPQVANLIRGKKLDPKLLQRLKKTLRVVRAVLKDAEKKRITDSKVNDYSEVNDWLNDLNDAVYVADDLLDEVSTKAVTQKEVSNLSSQLFNVQDREMVSMLEDIVERLESLLDDKDSLDLKENPMENSSNRLTSTSLLDDETPTYGRDKDKEAIINLLDDNSDGKQVSVIPIVGMGGVGKTTLAQLVYNDENFKQKFDFNAWVCVSENFDIRRVTKVIIEAVTRKTCEINDLDLLQQDLREKLKGKKFLIVLDDVWMEDYDTWNLLKKPFQRGIGCSKILVTTRSEKVASIVQTVQTYHLDQLSEEDCWLVFANHACFSSTSSRNVTALEEIGRKIAGKCKGLPLAARSLGGILRKNDEFKDWNDILNNDIWELPESKIIPALEVSYHYLPSHLKRCFVYCSLYPKDHVFDKNDLILLWMAEDFLPTSNKGKTLEEVGSEYFDYLVSRSFLQRTCDSFVMHDLMHDLATFLGGDFYFRSKRLGETKISSKTRHLSCEILFDENIEVLDEVKFLRTFLPDNFFLIASNREMVASNILSKLKYLRVLSFCHSRKLDALPHSIGELIHLRYLDLSYTSIMALPESLCKLYNLQTLKLFGCRKLTMLPSDMQNLVNLHHLDIGDDDKTYFEEMPKGMSKLNQLQHLPYFIVGRHEENGIKELGGLSNLHGSLEILSLENVTNSSEALEARIMDKKHINKLSLKWTSDDDDCTDSQIEFDILCKLQPHQHLQVLSISGYRGTRFPDWVGNSSYHNTTDLTLDACNNCCMLPSLGQLPSLKNLSISRFDVLQTIDASFYKNDDSSHVTPFPSLESLTFEFMDCWEEWSSFESDAFSQLKHLKISECPELRGALPNHLPALETLSITGCEQLASSLPRSPAMCKLKISRGNPLVVESVIEAINNSQLTCLQSLKLRYCSSEISFPWNCLPTSLTNLVIHSYDHLTSLPLESFPNLKNLVISKCENLESLFMPQSLHNLREFHIYGCPNFVSFPTEGLPAPNMTALRIWDCNKLKSMPRQMNTLLSRLQDLSIGNCPEIEWFPEGGMPPNLRNINIINCEKLLSGQAWPSVNMLPEVMIYGPCDGIKSFPNEGLLPASLTTLTLCGFSNLETLDCKGLLNLTSLQNLTIQRCPKLENLEGESLPASLTTLYIFECPLLQERCRMKHPEIWPKISHISNRFWV